MCITNVELDQKTRFRNRDLDVGEYVMIAVSDTGVGMTEEVKSHLFEPFFTTRKSQENMGIGLFRVQGYLAVTGGTIEVKSDGKSYSDFCLSLPKARPA